MDTTPIVARLKIIANCVFALRELGQLPLNDFLSDYLVCSAAERNFQVAIQAALDIGSVLLSESGTDVPRE